MVTSRPRPKPVSFLKPIFLFLLLFLRFLLFSFSSSFSSSSSSSSPSFSSSSYFSFQIYFFPSSPSNCSTFHTSSLPLVSTRMFPLPTKHPTRPLKKVSLLTSWGLCLLPHSLPTRLGPCLSKTLLPCSGLQ